ncbi:MAG: carbohydrate kinase family protein [Bacillota bacterium]
MAGGVLCVGTVNLDRIYLVTNLPTRDGGAWIRSRFVTGGGVEGNVASAVARLGHAASVISRVADDEEGRLAIADLAERGVDCRGVQVVQTEDGTPFCLIYIDPNGDRMIVCGGQATRQLQWPAGAQALAAGAGALFTSGYTPMPVVREALTFANQHGIPVAFDLPDTFDDLERRGFAQEFLLGILPRFTLFMSNGHGLRSFTGAPDLAAALRRLRDWGCRSAAVSFGARGSVVLDGERTAWVPAFKPPAIRDTTGAGDAYHGALIAFHLLEGESLLAAAVKASMAGALNCRGLGAREGLPSAEEIESFRQSLGRPATPAWTGGADPAFQRAWTDLL